MARMQRRIPARMTLSPNVARPAEKNGPRSKPARRPANSPFAGMNQVRADMHRMPRSRSEAQIKRSPGGRETRQSDRGKRETFRALKMQRALTAIPYERRNAVKERIAELNSFDDFSLLSTIKEAVVTQALAGMVDISPTPVQRLAIPALLGDGRSRRHREERREMEQVLLAAETGSGKTLAYLLPVLDAIKRAEATEAENEARRKAEEDEKKKENDVFHVEPPPLSNAPHSTTARPRAIILVPTAELVTQVGSIAKSLSHVVKFRAALVSTAYTTKVIRNRLFAPTGVDLVICTPHLLASVAESDPNILSRVSRLVIDEADSLLDRSFAPSTSAIVDKATPSLRQLILCSATIPRSLDGYLRKRFPDIRRLVTPNLHAIPRRVQLNVVDVAKDPYRGNKDLACAETIWSVGKEAGKRMVSDPSGNHETLSVDIKRILVFVNEREKTEELAGYLNSKGIDAVALNRDTPEQRNVETLGAFTSAHRETISFDAPAATPGEKVRYSPDSVSARPTPKRHLPNTQVLVATDLGSRGIDTLAVRLVILYDVPHSSVDFIHRLGRTGRMGRRGKGIVLVGKGDRSDVVREVQDGMFRGQALI
ncbi:MAG: hypothetical protein LQ342_007118 [Letrouitia transgressa]|nr:MAG: hypothetical protein LQ342_007118 [Letrouitia transgressa]